MASTTHTERSGNLRTTQTNFTTLEPNQRRIKVESGSKNCFFSHEENNRLTFKYIKNIFPQ